MYHYVLISKIYILNNEISTEIKYISSNDKKVCTNIIYTLKMYFDVKYLVTIIVILLNFNENKTKVYTDKNKCIVLKKKIN